MMNGLLIFDLDGTLLRTQVHICKAVRKTLRAFGLPEQNDETVIGHIGESSGDFCRAIAVGCRDLTAFQAAFRANERAALLEEGQLYAGIPSLLAEWKEQGFQLSACSSGSREYVELALKATGIRALFDRVVSAADFGGKSEAVRQLLHETACGCAILIGDRSYDFLAARENGIPSIAVQYGYGTQEEMARAGYIADRPAALTPLINQITLYHALWERIVRVPGVRCVGVNGVDTAGKSLFADGFAAYLNSRGVDVAVIHLDDFHHPRATRLSGENEVDAYLQHAFDLRTLIRELLDPLRREGAVSKTLTLLDLEQDTYSLKRRYEIGPDTVVLLEGVLLYREPLEDYIDYKVFLSISFDEVLRRAARRDVALFGDAVLEKYRNKYIPIQQWYLNECKPMEKSDAIVDNSDYDAPKLIQ